MCLHTKQRKPAVAKKVIICYKTVRRLSTGFFSEFYSFRYKIGREYTVRKGKLISFPDNGSYLKNNIISYGFHSYARLKDAINDINYKNNEVVLKCEIPAGARYWTGNIDLFDKDDYNYKEYCSERIKVVAWRYKKDSKWNYGTIPGE